MRLTPKDRILKDFGTFFIKMNGKYFSDSPARTLATLLTMDPAVLVITHLYSYQPMCQKYLMASDKNIWTELYREKIFGPKNNWHNSCSCIVGSSSVAGNGGKMMVPLSNTCLKPGTVRTACNKTKRFSDKRLKVILRCWSWIWFWSPNSFGFHLNFKQRMVFYAQQSGVSCLSN